ncbi:DUF2637 domain-containing protein [Angustibacter luteus]|uniref:DUF2637 domain-containing protein n=2 Tax=Angustibacter luteus TaxID=658456 RepID=A0ABW1JEN4_9ACTN
MDAAIAVGVSVLVAIGFVTSYDTLRLLAATDGGFAPWLAPAVPLSFDLGIVVLSLKVLSAARVGKTALTLRVLVIALSVASVAANGAASAGAPGRLLHAVPPAMFVICFESVIASARRQALAGQRRRPRRAIVWLLAPRATWRTWRAAILAEGQATPMSVTTTPARPSRRQPAQTPRADRARRLEPPAERPGRAQVAERVLRTWPDMTAAELAAQLNEHGHQVSVRTAQRIKAQALDAAA